VTEATTRQAWVELPDDETVMAALPPGVKPVYNFGFIAGMSRLRLAHPEIGRPFGALYAAIMFGPGQLTRREREMIAAVAAAAQDCHY
jgi:alkylhydroperoxidase/carboxymuconolactone decarboxylase family protein YurZ